MKSEKKNIYIVDDIEENLQVVGAMLKEEGLNISFARNGESALKGIAKKIPDLILLDISMPEMDGYEVCEHLKTDKATADIPVIFLTGRSQADDIIKGFQYGAVDYVTKPFNAEELLARVSTHLELKESRDIISRQNNELKELNSELYQLSITDKLTGIYNRLYIMEMISKEFSKSKRNNSTFSCILFDIDHFKKFNDTYGHLAGDHVLEKTAQLARDMIRTEDSLGRYGGEEFLLVLPDINAEKAEAVGEKIRAAIQDCSYTFGKHTLNVTISLGVSDNTRSDPEDEKEIIDNADKALYKAKNEGRNRAVLFSSW